MDEGDEDVDEYQRVNAVTIDQISNEEDEEHLGAGEGVSLTASVPGGKKSATIRVPRQDRRKRRGLQMQASEESKASASSQLQSLLEKASRNASQ